jgi:hypothetical protein
MSRTDLVSIIALVVGVALSLTGILLATNGSPAGIWVLIAGVLLFGVVKFSINAAQLRRARRSMRSK